MALSMEKILSKNSNSDKPSKPPTEHKVSSSVDNDTDDDFYGSLSSVNNEEEYIGQPQLIAIIGDEDTCVGFILAGIGELDESMTPNYFVVDRKTDEFKLELVFLDMLERPDIGLILITREAAEKIAPIINQHKGLEPTVMVIPGHNGPYEFDLPLAVKYIEDKKMASATHGSRRGSTTSITSVKTIDSHHGTGALSRRVSTHSMRSIRSCKSIK